jgi:2-dehydropantoate 2-reductase
VKLLVLGAGGIGGYFGGRLAQAGADVTFLVRPRRRSQLDKGGLRLTSPLGDLTLRVQTASADSLGFGYDLVLLTCKAYDLDSAMTAIAPAMAKGCVVLPMLNGMAHLARLDQRFGQDQVMGGTCAINVALREDGVIEHGDALQRLTFGMRSPQQSERSRELADVLAKSRIEWVRSDDIEQDLWEKIVFLSVLAAATCLFRGNVREIIAAPGGREAIERALDTNISIAAREGHPPRAAAIEFGRTRLTDPTGTWSASMLRDLESGRPVESDHIVGWMLEKARKHGLDDTLLSLAFTHLKTYEARRAAARL